MSIEFNCPYCTAAIRVPDTASGKRGTCPKCATKLLVPVVEIPDRQSLADSGSLQPVGVATPGEGSVPPIVAPNTANAVPETGLDVSTNVPMIASGPAHTKKRSRRKKRSRGRNSGLWIPGSLVASAVVVGVSLFVLYDPTVKLEGALTGTRLASVNIAPGQMTANDVDVSAAKFSRAVQTLQADPLVLTSELVRTEIRGNGNAIEVSIDMTSSAEFVAVELTDPVLKQYVSDNALVFGKQRLRQLRQSATQLVRELSQDGDRRLTNPSELRNAVALNLLRNGFGFVVDGAAGKLLCPCVYESGNQLWFAVPAGTTSFVLRGRTIDGLGQQFPGRYQITVKGQSETVVIETAEEETPGDADSIDEPTESVMSAKPEPETE